MRFVKFKSLAQGVLVIKIGNLIKNLYLITFKPNRYINSSFDNVSHFNKLISLHRVYQTK